MGSREEVKLLSFWVSPFALRVEWALKLKGVNYEYIEEDIFNKSDLLLELNPVHKKVPVLVHGPNVIAESFIILEYIDETWKQCPLLPQDPYERANARFWAKSAEEKVFGGAWYAMLWVGDEKEKERGIKTATDAIEKIEEIIKGKKFFGGEDIGYMDIALGCISYLLPILEEVGSLKILDPLKFPSTAAWTRMFLDHPVVKGTIPPHNKMLVYFHDLYKELSSAPSSKWFKL